MARRTDRPAMTIAVDFGSKATKQTNKKNIKKSSFMIFTLIFGDNFFITHFSKLCLR